MRPAVRSQVCLLAMVGGIMLPAVLVMSSETEGVDLTQYTTVEALLGPNVEKMPKIIISNKTTMEFPLIQLESFLECLCDKENQQCSVQAMTRSSRLGKTNHYVTLIREIKNHKKDNAKYRDTSIFGCRYAPGNGYGFINCAKNSSTAGKWTPSNENSCDYRCISLYWYEPYVKNVRVRYEGFGLSQSKGSQEFCVDSAQENEGGDLASSSAGDGENNNGSQRSPEAGGTIINSKGDTNKGVAIMGDNNKSNASDNGVIKNNLSSDGTHNDDSSTYVRSVKYETGYSDNHDKISSDTSSPGDYKNDIYDKNTHIHQIDNNVDNKVIDNHSQGSDGNSNRNKSRNDGATNYYTSEDDSSQTDQGKGFNSRNFEDKGSGRNVDKDPVESRNSESPKESNQDKDVNKYSKSQRKEKASNYTGSDDGYGKEFLLLCIACGISVLLNIGCVFFLWCARRSTDNDSKPLFKARDSNGVSNEIYLDSDHRAGLGVDRIPASGIDLNYPDHHQGINTALSVPGVSFVNNGFLAAGNESKIGSNCHTSKDRTVANLKHTSAPKTPAVFYRNTDGRDSEFGEHNIAYIESSSYGDDNVYAVVKETELETAVDRSGQAPLYYSQPQQDSIEASAGKQPPEHGLSLKSAANHRPKPRNQGNEYVDDDALWGSSGAHADVGDDVIPTFDDEGQQENCQGLDGEMKFVASDPDIDEFYSVPVSHAEDNIYSESDI